MHESGVELLCKWPVVMLPCWPLLMTCSMEGSKVGSSVVCCRAGVGEGQCPAPQHEEPHAQAREPQCQHGGRDGEGATEGTTHSLTHLDTHCSHMMIRLACTRDRLV